MNNKFYLLSRLLEKELSYQEKILALLARERAAIVKLNQEEMDKVRETKEKLVQEAAELGEKRETIMNAIAAESSGDESKHTLKQLLEFCSETPVKKELSKIGDSLKTAAASVKKMNEENGQLIRNSLGLVATTLAIIQSQPDTELPTYSRGKRLTSDSDEPAFTRRGKSVISSA